jgi:hypothetical protein
MFTNLVARHHLSSAFHEHEKDGEMLTLQFYRVTALNVTRDSLYRD